VRPDPRSHRDWRWVAIPLILPPGVPAGAKLHLPTLRVAGRRVRGEVAFTYAVPKARRDGHVVALGIDWGLNTLLSAGAARLHADGQVTTLGAGAQYRVSGVLARQHRLRRQGERLHAKLGHYQRLTAGDQAHPLTGKAAVIAGQARHVAGRRSNLNDALAWSAARWAADQAISAGATVIYIEDLASMEARGMGRTMNVRPAVPGDPRQDRRQAAAPGRRGGNRGRHRPGTRHVEKLPPLPGTATALQGPRHAHDTRVEMGQVPRVRLAG
jgi:hypothetical protein